MTAAPFTQGPRRNRLRRTAKTALIGTALTATILSTTACLKIEKPSLPPIAGVREKNGDLLRWTGTPCIGVTKIMIGFTAKGTDSTMGDDFDGHYLILTAPEPGVTVEHFDIESPPQEFKVKQPLPHDFDWRSAEVISIIVSGDDQPWSATVFIDELLTDPPPHDADTYFFKEFGWMNPTDIAEGNGKDFITICTPDPAKDDE